MTENLPTLEDRIFDELINNLAVAAAARYLTATIHEGASPTTAMKSIIRIILETYIEQQKEIAHGNANSPH